MYLSVVWYVCRWFSSEKPSHLDYAHYHGHSIAYHPFTEQWFTTDHNNSSNGSGYGPTDDDHGSKLIHDKEVINKILPPVLPTIDNVRNPRSVVTTDGLWLRITDNNNTLHSYNIRTRHHSVIPLLQPLIRGHYTRPDRLVALNNGWILVITHAPDVQLEDSKGSFQLLNPTTGDIQALPHYQLPQPDYSSDSFDIMILNCDDLDHDHDHGYDVQLLVASFQFGYSGTTAPSSPFWVTAISTRSSSSTPSSSPLCKIGQWVNLDVSKSLPSSSTSRSFRGVID
jgi:hypothetical protein